MVKSTMPVCHNQCCLLDGFQVHSSLEDYLTSLVASVCCSQQSSLLLLLRLRVPLCLFSGKFTCIYWLLACDSRDRHLTLAKRHLSNEHRNSIVMTCITQILVVLLTGCATRGIFFQPIRRVVHVISMEFLRPLLRRRFGRTQVATSRNIGCFLRITGFTLKRNIFFCLSRFTFFFDP